jgi:hypothetical protein
MADQVELRRISMATVSFANDIAPTLFKYRGQMAWRFDLASYDDVKANAQLIADQITPNPPGTPPSMPPPPFPPFPKTFIDAFAEWITNGCPP